MSPNPQFPAGLVTFTEKSFNGKLHLLCSDNILMNSSEILQHVLLRPILHKEVE